MKRILFLVPLLLQAVLTLATIPVVISSAGPDGWAAIALGQSVGGIGAVVVSLGWGVSGPLRLAALDVRDHPELLRTSFATRALAGIPAAVILCGISALIATDQRLEAILGCLTTLLLAFNSTWYFLGKSDPIGLLKLDAVPRLVIMAAGWILVALGSNVVVGLALQCVAPVVASLLVYHRRKGDVADTNLNIRNMVSEIAMQRNGMASQVIPAAFNFSPLVIVSLLAPTHAPAFALVDKVQKQLVTGFVPFGNMLISKAAAQVAARIHNPSSIARKNTYWVLGAGLITGLGTLVMGYVLVEVLSSGTMLIEPGTLLAMSGVVAASFMAAVLPATSMSSPRGLMEASKAAAWGALCGVIAIFLLTSWHSSFGAELGLFIGFLVTATLQTLASLRINNAK